MREFLFGDWGTKFVAFCLALVLWAYLYSESEGTKELNVDFVLEYVNPDVASIRKDDGTDIDNVIRVKFRGPRSALADLDKVRPRYRFKLTGDLFPSGVKEGPITHTISRDNFENLPPRVNFQVEGGDVLKFKFVMFALSDELTVKTEIQGAPAPGFELLRVTTDPQRVRVRYPSTIPLLDEIRLDPIDIHGRKNSFELPGRLAKSLRDMGIAPTQEIRVTIEIGAPQKPPGQKPITLPVRLMAPAEDSQVDVRITSKTVTVTLEGPDEILSRVNADNACAFVDPQASGLPDLSGVGPEGLDYSFPVAGVVFTKDPTMAQTVRFKPSPDVKVAVVLRKKP